ncbi:MAG: hypothetical protein H6654_14665 [Ardenticatenaceae bacterium]|nr:hypothetical protein [Anaerolineales bacterium]MCB8939042.1 hypothetical protein [Ardenticatenaceae bacterium]MCB8974798.1 hypothetical protein [Ardenticatenaceae bacterium]
MRNSPTDEHLLKQMEEIEYVKEARNYLLSFDDVNENILDAQLHEWKERKPTNLEDLFRAFLLHAQNRQGMPNSVGDISNLSSVLCDFQPKKVGEIYSSWEDIFDAIVASEYSPPGRMVKENSKSYWVIYCKSIISVAKFLSSYESISEFDAFVDGFLTNEYSRLALPLLLKEELFGFGFALACDFLKESGYPHFIKPDTHINDIARGLGITSASNDFQIFKDVVAYCRRINVVPYELDKLFWLVGSGRFYNFNVKIPSSKWEFIQIIRAKELGQ